MGGADLGRPRVTIPYRAIPGFPRPSVAGHPGELSLVGSAAVLRGRVHFYEGFSFEEVTRPVRSLALLGVRTLVLANASGGIRPSFRPGDLLLVDDHLNLMGANPLRRFVDLSEAYDLRLRALAERSARKLRIPLRKGVYAAVPGPSYETPAEVRMLRSLGADAVGMSTVPEVLAARAEGMRVLAVSIVANRAGRSVTHDEVLRATAGAAGRLAALFREILAGLAGRKPS
jgi:purine-nucleoside phosphorylase